MTRNPRTHDMIAAGPAIDDASHAPNSQPDPIKEPNPNKTSWDRLILSLCNCLSLFINTPSLLPKIQKIICEKLYAYYNNGQMHFFVRMQKHL